MPAMNTCWELVIRKLSDAGMIGLLDGSDDLLLCRTGGVGHGISDVVDREPSPEIELERARHRYGVQQGLPALAVLPPDGGESSRAQAVAHQGRGIVEEGLVKRDVQPALALGDEPAGAHGVRVAPIHGGRLVPEHAPLRTPVPPVLPPRVLRLCGRGERGDEHDGE
jgi:hypothetical protein